ncbi:hypothetical protein [Phenylobacterium ferrooxidans]|uniref:Tail assembly chaperone n=1 Tax=Phenylobacterium ferrooxidans TaxID=2982689 RepID=A0ABW6CJG1_9CAUL
MARESQPTDFVITVEGIGAFTFSKRTLRSGFAISAEYARLTEGEPLDALTGRFAEAVATLKILTVAAPDGWAPSDLDDLSPFDDEAYANLVKVWSALSEKEETFRRPGAKGKSSGEGEGGDV